MGVKYLFSFCVFLIFALKAQSSIIDFGVKGPQYEISEKDFYAMVQKKLKDLRQKNIKQQLTKSIYGSLKANINISTCSENQEDYIEEDYMVAPMDVILPSGEILAKKGERVAIPKSVHLPDAELCLVDGDNEDEMIEDINLLYKQNHKCSFLLNNYSVANFKKQFPQVRNVYILDKSITKRFRINCLPTRIELKGNTVGHYFIKKGRSDG